MVKHEKDENRMCKFLFGDGHVTIWHGTINGRIGDMVIQILCTANFDTVVIPSYLKRQDEYFKNDMVPIFGTSPIPLMTI
jgi:prepilin-type processing-associated H-X9-DG protein